MHYEYSSTDKDKFSLHDCRAKSIELTDRQVVFCFPDGIFFKDYSDDWPNTGKAALTYTVDDDVVFYLFDDKEGLEIREKYTIEQLAEKINTKEWELEFAYQYDGYQEVLHTGWIWQNNKPWTRECQMFIRSGQGAVYSWDSPDAEKK